MNYKDFTITSIQNNPERYAIDGGDLNLINDYFTSRNWKPLTREQHVSIANIIRGRITVLKDNPLDQRKKFKPKDEPSQTDIYTMIGDATIETYGAKRGAEVEKILNFFDGDYRRVTRTYSAIKRSVRMDITNESIDLSKFIFSVCSKKETKKVFKHRSQHKQHNKKETK